MYGFAHGCPVCVCVFGSRAVFLFLSHSFSSLSLSLCLSLCLSLVPMIGKSKSEANKLQFSFEGSIIFSFPSRSCFYHSLSLRSVLRNLNNREGGVEQSFRSFPIPISLCVRLGVACVQGSEGFPFFSLCGRRSPPPVTRVVCERMMMVMAMTVIMTA